MLKRILSTQCLRRMRLQLQFSVYHRIEHGKRIQNFVQGRHKSKDSAGAIAVGGVSQAIAEARHKKKPVSYLTPKRILCLVQNQDFHADISSCGIFMTDARC